MEIKIPDSDLSGFNDNAKSKLEDSCREFVDDLITEVNRIESSRNSTGKAPEITSSMINDANILLRHGLVQPKKSLSLKFLRIGAAILSLIVGILYNPVLLQNSGFMFLYIVVITATILTVTISTIKE